MSEAKLLQQAVEALKPCPFCGGSGWTYFNGSYWAVLCNKCEGEGPPSDHEGGAIAYWNGRLQEAALQQQPEPVAVWQSQCKDGTWVDCTEANARAAEERGGYRARVLYTAPALQQQEEQQ